MQDDVKLPPESAEADPTDNSQTLPAPISDIVQVPANTEPIIDPEQRPGSETENHKEARVPATGEAPKQTHSHVIPIIFAITIMLVLSGIALYPILNK